VTIVKKQTSFSFKTTTLRQRSVQFLLILLLVLLSTAATDAAQIGERDPGTSSALLVTGGLTLFFVLFLFFLVFVLESNVDPIFSFFRAVWNYIVPQSIDKPIQLKHDFDGIVELDNRIPPWFNYLFASTVIFAAVYMVDYHLLGTSKLPGAEYADELQSADLLRRIRIASEGAIDETKLAVVTDAAQLKAGKDNFLKYCVTCHGSNGGGIVGPNLTDQYWIHGGGITNVFTTIKNGVPAKGMISWKLVFTPREILQLGSYVLSLQGSNPLNAKKPEGNLYVEPKPLLADTVNVAPPPGAKRPS
jgi:cytochrome c oxidase cbb3-type subunit III